MTALKAEFSNNTVRNYVFALSGLFERAVKYELIARNPASAKMLDNLPPQETGDGVFWQPATAALLLHAARRRAELK